jgi:hypothetical protein
MPIGEFFFVVSEKGATTFSRLIARWRFWPLAFLI